MTVRSLLLCLLALVSAVDVGAQRRAASIPPNVARDIETLHNAPGSRREIASVSIAAGEVVAASLAVRNGPASIAGHIRGSVVGINANITLLPGARVDGDIIVVGGQVDGRSDAQIGGDVRVYSDVLRYRIDGDRLIVEGIETREESDSDFWRRRDPAADRTRFDLLSLATARTYNRVEGLPVLLGPRLRVQRGWGSLTVEARGIVRTAEPVRWDRGTLGHDARVDLRFGTGAGWGFGVEHYDQVAAVEEWQMSPSEAGIGSAVLRRDFRDHYGRLGGRGTVRGFLTDDVSLRVSVAEERWTSREARNPWTLLRSDDRWRPNPTMDEGVARLFTTGLDIDTRNQRYSPWAGWYVNAEVERGTLNAESFGARRAGPVLTLPVPDEAPTWTRGFLDVRRYNRLTPGAQLNVRAVVGGWMGGDALPLQRRLSVGGPATLPGFDFRRHWRGGEDRLQCSEPGGVVAGVPAMCDRIALIQVEYQGSLGFDVADYESTWIPAELDGPTWIAFANAGRGWRARDDALTSYGTQSFPAFSTYKSDIGLGLDFGALSVAVAKSVSDAKEPVNVIVRLERRF
jgi:hypothetical protein